MPKWAWLLILIIIAVVFIIPDPSGSGTWVGHAISSIIDFLKGAGHGVTHG
jgi:hypothetical protein